MFANDMIPLRLSSPVPIWPIARPADQERLQNAGSHRSKRSQAARRPRQSKPKVKTGCLTCKGPSFLRVDVAFTDAVRIVRKVKCDEEKPACKKCTSTGRKCDGYTVIESQDSSGTSRSTPTSDRNVLVAPYVLEIFHGSSEERRSFAFFRDQTAIQLSGFYDCELWTKVIVQAAHHKPVIRHAVLALSSLHERFQNGDRSIVRPRWTVSEGGFALEQYNRAIREMISPAAGESFQVDVCLMSCMLFATFETLRGHHGSALSHITSGVKILSEIETIDSKRPCHDILHIPEYPLMRTRDLEMMFNRLDNQVSQMLGTPPMQLDRSPEEPAKGFQPQIPIAFTSLDEARNSMDYHFNRCVRVLFELDNPPNAFVVTDESRPLLHNCQELLATWDSAFDAFRLAAWDSLDVKARAGVRVLQLVRVFWYACLDAYNWNAAEETVWDRYISEFRYGVELAEEVIASTATSKPQFCLEMYFVGPLYAICHKCRDPVIRRRALGLLKASSRQEGIWDSANTARAAELIISIEESDLGPIKTCADVPDWARLSAVEVKFEPSGRAGTIKYWRASPTEGNKKRRDYIETLMW